MENGEFHWRDGIYFKRMDDGSVRLRAARLVQTAGTDVEAVMTRKTAETDYLCQIIPPNEWASIVANVADGGSAKAYSAAQMLHGFGVARPTPEEGR